MEKVSLSLAERQQSYDILIGEGLINQAGSLLQERGFRGRVMVVTNPTVAGWYLNPLLKSLSAAGFVVESVEVPDGESYKSLEQANLIYNRLIDGHYDRKTLLIALGGGVIGDLTGFIAATYLRGVPFIQIPTTLLAQVDSSVGGKVAVNHPMGKNLIGAFYQPKLVISDVLSLKTLPERELSSGMAEVIKHGLILDENYFQFILGEFETIRQIEPGIMTWIVMGSCKIKADIVETDEKETGIRAILNFGHTVGHSLESITHYNQFKHGEAVALGMLAAIKIAEGLALIKETEMYPMVEDCLVKLDLPTRIPGLSLTEIWEGLLLDKKAESGKIRWILPNRLGNVDIIKEVPQLLVESVLLELGAKS